MSESQHTISLLPLAFETHTVRMFLDAQGQTWWVAVDVGDVLGIEKVRNTLADFPADEKGANTVGTLGGPQSLLTVNEPGLYRLMSDPRNW